MARTHTIAVGTGVLVLAACTACTAPKKSPEEGETPTKGAEAKSEPKVDRKALLEQTQALFGSIEPENTHEDPKVEKARVELGRALYYDTRLSKNQDLSCNSCHDLANYGIDVREQEGKRGPFSAGHKGAFGGRNSPTTYNAFVHIAQFWDGRAADVEEQAMGPVTNPVEMAMPDAAYAERVLTSIPGYEKMFAAAFPEEKKPVNFANFAKAVGAFERKLVTPSKVDAFLSGQEDALSEQEARGFSLFAERCTACHMGKGFGGAIYQKLGLMKPYPTKDMGRFEVTKDENDKMMFKVPSLRNIAETAPYFHDGSLATLEEAVAVMSEYQTAQGKMNEGQIADVVAFLKALTGELPKDLIAKPELPESGPKTPKADPS